MKTAHAHTSNFGNIQNSIEFGSDGFAIYHNSDRYGSASNDQIEFWSTNRILAVRNAAHMEDAQRNI